MNEKDKEFLKKLGESLGGGGKPKKTGDSLYGKFAEEGKGLNLEELGIDPKHQEKLKKKVDLGMKMRKEVDDNPELIRKLHKISCALSEVIDYEIEKNGKINAMVLSDFIEAALVSLVVGGLINIKKKK